MKANPTSDYRISIVCTAPLGFAENLYLGFQVGDASTTILFYDSNGKIVTQYNDIWGFKRFNKFDIKVPYQLCAAIGNSMSI